MASNAMHRVAEAEVRLQQARSFDRSGQVLQAEMLYRQALRDMPGHGEATLRLAQLSLDRGRAVDAIELLRSAIQARPADSRLAIELAALHVRSEQPRDAIDVLLASLRIAPEDCRAWLMLGQVYEDLGEAHNALKAWYQAVTRAQRVGHWRDEASTPAALLHTVLHAIEILRLGKRKLFFGVNDSLRERFGPDALKRVDRALSGFLRDWDATPNDSRQRPRFLYFPDLPDAPYHDPQLQPWSADLAAATAAIRADALRVIEEDQMLPNFVDIKTGDRMENYVAGDGLQPAWEAFFFYRHGLKIDVNHERCPSTSTVLESLDLCRIAEHAPEVCFSVLKPGTHILPHYGVTNTRLVMHLPLSVPPGCALNVIDAGEHHWKEGQLVMFDDTFQHEAWNRSSSSRVILLMDCWNPHLTEVERLAVKDLIETIGSLHRSARSTKSAATLPN